MNVYFFPSVRVHAVVNDLAPGGKGAAPVPLAGVGASSNTARRGFRFHLQPISSETDRGIGASVVPAVVGSIPARTPRRTASRPIQQDCAESRSCARFGLYVLLTPYGN